MWFALAAIVGLQPGISFTRQHANTGTSLEAFLNSQRCTRRRALASLKLVGSISSLTDTACDHGAADGQPLSRRHK